jgi:nucleotide-binding universal stress UspA family protein
MVRVKRILAPTDFSELSKLGIRYAFDMARDTGAEVIVYHTIDLGEEWRGIHTDRTLYHDMLEEHRRRLDKFIADSFPERIDCVEARLVVEFGSSFKNIVDLAEKENVDLIVMSTHGRTGLDHAILGSVTEKVVARAPCPVLVVPRRARPASLPNAA